MQFNLPSALNQHLTDTIFAVFTCVKRIVRVVPRYARVRQHGKRDTPPRSQAAVINYYRILLESPFSSYDTYNTLYHH
jgi:hypothetical protein